MLTLSDKRAITIIKRSLDKLQVHLTGFNVLTEVGSGFYKYTPIIAALAGAKEVNACTGDSRYGKGVDNISDCKAICDFLGLPNVNFFNNEIPADKIRSSNIITNSGFLRPLNEKLLRHIDPDTTVIPLMFEAWELRTDDIDIEYCKKANIRVAGTWENHPDILVFNAVEALALKMAFEAGYEVYQNNIVVWGDDHFGTKAYQGFLKAGAASVVRINTIDELKRSIEGIDFIYLCDYFDEASYFGLNGKFESFELLFAENSIGIVHLFGAVDTTYLKAKNIFVYPEVKGRSRQMTFTLGHVGLKPIINLQCAGFKVAQDMLQGRLSSLMQPISF
jgi:hypothetical protein